MAEILKLSEAQITDELASIPLWQRKHGKLHRELEFTDFVHAFGFMTQVALVAEASTHHPEWFNVYNRVIIDLETHDVGGLSIHDFALARRIDEIAAQLSS